MNKILKIFNNIVFVLLPFIVIYIFNLNKITILNDVNFKNSSVILLLLAYITFTITEIKGLINKKGINYDNKYNLVILLINVSVISEIIIFSRINPIISFSNYYLFHKYNIIMIGIMLILLLIYRYTMQNKSLYNNILFMLAWCYTLCKYINKMDISLIVVILFVIVYLINLINKKSILYIDEYNDLIKSYNLFFVLYFYIFDIFLNMVYVVNTIFVKINIIVSVIFLCFIVLTFIKNMDNKKMKKILYITYYFIIIATILFGAFIYIIDYII